MPVGVYQTRTSQTTCIALPHQEHSPKEGRAGRWVHDLHHSFASLLLNPGQTLYIKCASPAAGSYTGQSQPALRSSDAGDATGCSQCRYQGGGIVHDATGFNTKPDPTNTALLKVKVRTKPNQTNLHRQYSHIHEGLSRATTFTLS